MSFRARSLAFCVIALVVAFVGIAGCSKEARVRSEIKAQFDQGEHRETIALCRLAIRNGVDAGFVYYYWGASLLAMNREYEAFSKFDEAAKRSFEDRRAAGELLAKAGLEGVKSGNTTRAARLLRKAQELDPTIEFGPATFVVADACFEEKDFNRAALLYTKAVEAFPDTSACETAYYNLSISRAAMGDTTRAMEVLETFLDRYPRSEFRTDAKFRFESMLFEKAQETYGLGNYEDAITMVEDILARTSNTGLTLKSRFLLGEIYEAQGDYESAYKAYHEVIQGDLGASGRIVQLAREKMDAISEAGLR